MNMDIFRIRKLLTHTALGVTACVLIACGGSVSGSGGGGAGGGAGGGGDGGSPSAPTLSLTPQSTKVFRFSWAPVSGATRYVLLEDLDGASGFQPATTDDLPAGASTYDHAVFLPARVNARYVLQACNATGCANSAAVSVSGDLAQATGYVKAPIQKLVGLFGARVALSGDGHTLAVGAAGDDSGATGVGGDPADNTATNSGAVYVFVRDGGTWVQQAYVKASNTEANDAFGNWLTLSANGDVLAVGAHAEDSETRGVNPIVGQDDNSAFDSGAVYVFRRNGGAWAQEAYVKASNAGENDRFGFGLALAADGNTLAVGAPFEDGIEGDEDSNGALDSGAAYVFVHNGSEWVQQAYVKSSNPDSNDRFGASLALSANGSTLAVGATDEDSNASGINNGEGDNSAINSGAAYVFVRSGSTWTQQAYVKASNTEEADAFGLNLAISADGGTLAVAALDEASNATGIGGDETNNGADNSGAVYVFMRSGSAWTQQAYVKASNTEMNDRFSGSIALSPDGNTLAVGTSFESSNSTGINGNQADNSASRSGAVYVMARRNGTWAQQAYVKAPNTEANDQFGGSVALGLDDKGVPVLAVGALNEDSAATGINGNLADNSVLNSGAVYLY